MLFFDPLWLLFAIPPILVMLYAQQRMKSTYSKYAKEANINRLTGAEVADRLLYTNGLHNVTVEVSHGELSDHYDPTTKTLRLSPDVYQTPSIASLGIVAHEVGHALQDAQGLSAHAASQQPGACGQLRLVTWRPGSSWPASSCRLWAWSGPQWCSLLERWPSTWSRCRWNWMPAAVPARCCAPMEW